MSIEISDADWNILDLTTKGGISEDDVAYSINAYREEGKSDEEIQQIINKKIEDARPKYESTMQRLRAAQAEHDNDPDVIRARKMKNALDVMDPIIGGGLMFANRAANSASMGLADAAAAGIDWAAKQIGLDTGLVESIKEGEEAYPIASTAGDIAGLFTPGGVAGRMLQYGAKAGKAAKGLIVGENASKLTKAGGYLTEVGIRSAAAEGSFQIQQNVERAAGTEDWEEGQSVLGVAGDFGQGTLANMGFDMMLGGAGRAYTKIKQAIKTTDSAVALLGGKTNVLKGREAFDAAKAQGLSDTEAAGAFFAKISEGLTPEQSQQIARMIQKSPQFRDLIMQQLAAGEQIVYKTASVLTNKEKGKMAENINDFLGKEYVDAVGAKQLGTTADDLVHYMGVDSKNFQEIKSKGLEEAQQNINRHFDEFEEGTKIAGLTLRRDYDATKAIVESTNVADFASLQPGGYAEKMMQGFIEKEKKNFIDTQMQALGNVAPEEAQEVIAQLSHEFDNKMVDRLKKQYAQTFCDNIIKNGSTNVYDLMDMQNHVKNVMKKDVMKGMSTAPGQYHKELNRMMGSESKILDGSLKAMQNSEEMLRLHKMGESFDGSQVTELKRVIDSANDAKEAATKLSGFKLGFENQLLDAMITGNSQKFSQLKAMTDKSGVLGEFFEKGELQKFAQASAPKVVAANNLRTWLKATGKYEGNAALIDAVIRTFISGAAGARVAGTNAALTTARKIGFGPRTMQAVEQFASNPSAAEFNKMINSAKDTTERNLMLRVIDSMGDATNQYLIMSGKHLAQGE